MKQRRTGGGEVIDLAEAREGKVAAEVGSSARGGRDEVAGGAGEAGRNLDDGYLGAWLRQQEDPQAVLRDNLRLRAEQAAARVTVPEYALYVASLLLYGGLLVGWALSLA